MDPLNSQGAAPARFSRLPSLPLGNEVGEDDNISRLVSEFYNTILNFRNVQTPPSSNPLIAGETVRLRQGHYNTPNGSDTISSSTGSTTFMVGLNGEFREFPLGDIFAGGTLSNLMESMENALAVALSTEDTGNRFGSPPASAQVVEQLPREKVSEENISRIRMCGPCVVCQEEYNAGDEIMSLSRDKDVCNHIFHVNCLLPWLNQHNSCPVCRFELPTDDACYESRRSLQRNASSAPRLADPGDSRTGAPNEALQDSSLADSQRQEQSQSPTGGGTSRGNITITGYRALDSSGPAQVTTSFTSQMPVVTSTISTTETSSQNQTSMDDIISDLHNAEHMRIHQQLHNSGIDLASHDLDPDSVSDFNQIDTIRNSNSCRMI